MESNIPQVSVIIPLYNKAPYIMRALDSVLAQTVQDFEVVVVGGKSTDGGEEIVKGYTDLRIRFIQEAGKGVSAARNQGVDEARAELVAFLDADDEWLPEFLETILRLRRKWPEAGLYGTGFKKINANGSEITCSFEPEKNDRLLDSFFEAKNRFCNYGPGMLFITSGTVVTKQSFLYVGGFPEKYKQSEDRALRGKIALYYPVAYSPNICNLYYEDTLANSSVIHEVLTDPFSDYIRTLSRDVLGARRDVADIYLFCDINQKYIIQRNIRDVPSEKKQIKYLICFILNPKMRIGVYLYYSIMMLLPKPYLDVLKSVYKTLYVRRQTHTISK